MVSRSIAVILFLLTATPGLAQENSVTAPSAPPPPPDSFPCYLRAFPGTHTYPEYPLWSTLWGDQGRTVLRVTVGIDGVPIAVGVSKSNATSVLDDAAVSHVKKFWRWRPQTDPACMKSQTILVNII